MAGFVVSGRLYDAAGALRDLLPRGGLLPAEIWWRRHRWIMLLLWAHAALIAVIVFSRGFGIAHTVFEGSLVATSALVAGHPALGQRVRSVAASLGLLSASAILVHLSGGYIEMHFHFFVMIIVISLYQDWWPFLLAVGYVVAHHGVVGILAPTSVYNHPDAVARPWVWAAIHGAFVLAASAASMIAWRLNEDLLRRQLATERRAREIAEAGVRVREEFLSVATHELRTPIASLKGYSQLALRALSDANDAGGDGLRRALQTLDEQADRLSRLVTQLLDVSRIEAGKLALEPVRSDLGALVLNAVEHARRHSELHTWRVDVPTDVAVVLDPARMEEVVTNLLENAVRYSPQGGTIEVTLSREEGGVRLEVADEGIGIPPEKLSRIFERFFQAHGERNYGGMGLGLYISREIVERHGGSISATPRAERGTRFAVRLPLGPAGHVPAPSREPAVPAAERASARAATGTAGRLLVIEDDEALRFLVTTLLRDAGYEVREAPGGKPALAALATWSPDLILLDKLMPDMDGTAFVSAYRERVSRPAPIVALCAARDAAAWAGAIDAVGCVTKPFDLDQVLREVSRHLPPTERPLTTEAIRAG